MVSMSTAIALLFGLVVAVASSADAAQVGDNFRATLRQKNSDPRPGKDVKSRGQVNIQLKDDMMWRGIVSIINIEEHITAHIHEGEEGVAGPVIFTALPAGIPLLNGTFSYAIAFPVTLFEDVELESGGYYFNVHTITFPAGEIRGQFFPPCDISGSDRS